MWSRIALSEEGYIGQVVIVLHYMRKVRMALPSNVGQGIDFNSPALDILTYLKLISSLIINHNVYVIGHRVYPFSQLFLMSGYNYFFFH